MPPNFQRFLPLLLVGVLILFVLPTLLRKHGSSGPNAAARATDTISALNLIDKAEQSYRVAHGRFTSHLADMITGSRGLANDLSIGLDVQLDVSTDGQTVLDRVTSDVLSLVRARDKSRVVAESCLLLKSGSGVSCPKPAR